MKEFRFRAYRVTEPGTGFVGVVSGLLELAHLLPFPLLDPMPDAGALEGWTWERVPGGMTIHEIMQWRRKHHQTTKPTPKLT